MLNPQLFNAALMGLDAGPLPPPPPPLAEAVARLPPAEALPRAYDLLALAYGSDRSGARLESNGDWQPIPPAPAPDARVLPAPARRVLAAWLEQDEHDYLDYALATLKRSGHCLDEASLQQLLLRGEVKRLKGRLGLLDDRGRWLLTQLGAELPNDLRTELGSAPTTPAPDADPLLELDFSGRRAHLSSLRRENPEAARLRVEEIWKGAPANHRLAYLELLRDNLSPADAPFIEACLKDRSSNVRETAGLLLARLPDSASTRALEGWLRQTLSHDKAGWHMTPLAFSKEMKALGLEEISSDKNESDDNFLRRQLIHRVHRLEFWLEMTHSADVAELAETLIRTPLAQRYFEHGWLSSSQSYNGWLSELGTAFLVEYLSRQPTLGHHKDTKMWLLKQLNSAQRERVLAAQAEHNPHLKLLFQRPEEFFLGHSAAARRWENMDFSLLTDFNDDTGEPWGERYSLLVLYAVRHCDSYVYYQHSQQRHAALPLSASPTLRALAVAFREQPPAPQPADDPAEVGGGNSALVRQMMRERQLLDSFGRVLAFYESRLQFDDALAAKA